MRPCSQSLFRSVSGSLALSLMLLLLPFPALAVTFTVNSTSDAVDCNPGDGAAETAPGNGICTLRAAIMEANALAGADTVDLPAGTYTLTITGTDEDAAATGDLDITEDLTINGAGESTTTIDANHIDRVFDILVHTVTGIFSQLTLKRGGLRESGSIYDQGGGIRSLGAVTATHCTFLDNKVGNLGGGFESYGTATVADCSFIGNEADGWGGGMFAGGTAVEVTGSTFDGNASEVGGGMYVIAATTVSDCTFSGNEGDWGGGLCNADEVTLANCTFSGNTAELGGGLYNSCDAVMTTLNCTVTENTGTAASSTGGLDARHGTAYTGNSIIAGNVNVGSVGGVYPDIVGLPVSLGHNIVGDATDEDAPSLGLASDMIGTASSPIDAMLGALANNGGPTQTHALLSGSPAFDAGNNALVTNPPFTGPPYYDQRGSGFPRSFDSDDDGTATSDIGAFESQTPGLGLALMTPGNVQASDGTLQDCVQIAWGRVPKAEQYRVYRGSEPVFATATLLGWVSETALNDYSAILGPATTGCNSPSAGPVYYYWVVAVSSARESAPSAPDSGYCGAVQPAGVLQGDIVVTVLLLGALMLARRRTRSAA